MPLIHNLINNVVHCGVTPKNKCLVSVQTISMYKVDDICAADDIACLNRPNHQVICQDIICGLIQINRPCVLCYHPLPPPPPLSPTYM